MGWALATGAGVGRLAESAARSWDDSLVGEWQGVHKSIVPRRFGLCASASTLLRFAPVGQFAIRALAGRPDVAASLAGMTSRRFGIDLVRA